MRTGVYNISCDYIVGCNYSGCSYELSSTNGNINGSIIGKNYKEESIEANSLIKVTVTDIKGDVVVSRAINIDSNFLCSTGKSNSLIFNTLSIAC